ncbi:MAG: YlbL family protein [Egibacteraceae bacterium]
MRPGRLAATVVAALMLVSAALLVPLPYFLETPGSVVGLNDRLQVEAPSVEPIDGDFLFTTVQLQRATLAQLVAAWFDPDTAVVSADEVIPPRLSDAAYFAHQQVIFEQSARRGAAVGLRAAGYAIGPEAFGGEGALVVDVMPGSPAEDALLLGDVILEVDGKRIETDDALRGSVLAQPLRLTVRRAGRLTDVEVTPRPSPDQPERPVLGILVMTHNATIDLPVPVTVDTGGTGGPSAGLMIALAVFDKVDPVDLAGGRLIAGTGTITFDGTVGLISGITQKVLAADRQGIDVFLAPQEQLAEARQGVPAGSDLRVIGVATFDEALRALR